MFIGNYHFGAIFKTVFIAGLAVSLVSCGAFEKKKNNNNSQIRAQAPKVIINEKKQEDSSYLVSFQSDIAGALFECKIESPDGGGNWEDCSDGSMSIPLKEFELTLLVKATVTGIDPTVRSVTIPKISISAEPPIEDQGVDAASIAHQQFLALPVYPGLQMDLFSILGGKQLWDFRVPLGFHFLSAASTANPRGGVDILQIMKEADPFYFGNWPLEFLTQDGCGIVSDMGVRINTPAGFPLGYCLANETFRTFDQLKFFLLDFFGPLRMGSDLPRLSANHVQIGSDIGLGYQSLIFQAYDVQRAGHDTYTYELCNSPLAFNREITPTNDVPWLQSFWAKDVYKLGTGMTCTIEAGGFGSGVWNIAGLTYRDPTNGVMLEVTYLQHGVGGLASSTSPYRFLRSLRDFVTADMIREGTPARSQVPHTFAQ
jgi:hypothetical protein